MIHTLTITRQQWQEICRHVEASLPNEACGLLAGKGNRAAKIFTVLNQAQSPVRFVMDPYEQLRAFQEMESDHLGLLGIFHSHPAGPSTVSPTDIAEAAYAAVHVVVSPGAEGWQARGFWIEGGEVAEAALEIVK
jgi:proteasome lid subunit RPN8/RPN11